MHTVAVKPSPKPPQVPSDQQAAPNNPAVKKQWRYYFTEEKNNTHTHGHSKNTQNCFAYNSATKYHSEAVLYSKQTKGYSLSPHIKTIAVAFLPAEI